MKTRKTTSELQLLLQDPLAASVGRDDKKERRHRLASTGARNSAPWDADSGGTRKSQKLQS